MWYYIILWGDIALDGEGGREGGGEYMPELGSGVLIDRSGRASFYCYGMEKGSRTGPFFTFG